MSHGSGKSDRGVVPKKLPNKAVGEVPAAAEVVEGRLRAKGNAVQQRMSRRSRRVYDVQTALDGVRQTARSRPGGKFTTLMHHIYQVERLRAAYMACKRDAAAGVDGQTWASYGQNLEAKLLELSDRLGRGGYRPQPVKRAYIDKADGSKRPLGGAHALLRRSEQRGARRAVPAASWSAVASHPVPPQPGQAPELETHDPYRRALVAHLPHLPFLPEPAPDRHDPRQEPCAVAPHARIRGGGAG